MRSINSLPLYDTLILILKSFSTLQKLEVQGRTFFMQASNNKEKEDWIGAFGRAMIKKTVLIDDEDMEDRYM